MVALMGWNPDYRYKLIGKVIRSNDEYLIVFDLTSTEVYQRTITEDQKVKTSKIPVFPQEWQNQFGLPFEEHRKSLQVNIFDGYAVYGFRTVLCHLKKLLIKQHHRVVGVSKSESESYIFNVRPPKQSN